MSKEVGALIREARLRSGFSQARLAELAGISRRQVASIENGANTSIRVLRLLAEALRIEQLPLGPATAHIPPQWSSDARILLQRTAAAEASVQAAGVALDQVRSALQAQLAVAPADTIADTPLPEGDPPEVSVPVVAEIAQGKLRWLDRLELVTVDRSRVETGEALVRMRKGMAREGIAGGDLAVVELRPGGNAATGELVIALIDGKAEAGRWWNKRGLRMLRGPRSGRVIRRIGPQEAVVIVGAITDIIRIRGR